MFVLGISCLYHDAAACLLRDGEIVAAAEEERFSRLKHDSRFPVAAISYCLGEAGIGLAQIDHVVFYEKPLLKFDRILSTAIETFPGSSPAFVRAMRAWLGEKLWTKATIRQRLGRWGPVYFGEHHTSHAASAFLVSPFEEAAILTADGVGEWSTTTVGVGSGTKIRLNKEIRFPHSLGLLYSVFTSYLGFEANEGEYKVMGLAAYGEQRYLDEVRRVIDVLPDGSYRLDMRYFEYHRSLRPFGRRFVELFGAPRSPGSPIEQRHADIAASLQAVLEDTLVRIATDLQRSTKLRRLCMAGGVALNGLANTRILNEAGYDELFVQPAAGDSGGAIGAAAHLYHAILGAPRTSAMTHAYLGPGFSDARIAADLASWGVHVPRSPEANLIETVAALLAEGKVVGWFRGRMEFGPRALGSRSILADPRRGEMKNLLNVKVKGREEFRPFAPVVTSEDASRYFDLRCASPFMLHIAPVRPAARSLIPAVTHVDGSARLQTLERDVNPSLHALLRSFERRTGLPMLVNTSFNVRGEPIVCTPAEAFADFSASGIDYLVIENRLLGPGAKRPHATPATSWAGPRDTTLTL